MQRRDCKARRRASASRDLRHKAHPRAGHDLLVQAGVQSGLQSGRLGVVLDQSERSLLRPRVKVFFSTRSNTYIMPEVLELGTVQTNDRIVGHEDPQPGASPTSTSCGRGSPAAGPDQRAASTQRATSAKPAPCSDSVT